MSTRRVNKEPVEKARTPGDAAGRAGLDFIRAIIEEDLASGKHDTVVTRFPPEPNGYLHIGHAKSICLNFGVAAEYGGTCNLRFDDTNPTTEDVEYVESIKEDVRWLGFEWNGPVLHASDYFERFYAWAEDLVRAGKAYVDSLSEEQIREYRGTVTEPGRESPYRDRTVEESLELLRGMRAGRFADGEHVLRARIDMAHPNMKMRDPLLYRIRHASHYRAGDAWCIYPMYDFAHPLSDAIEGITHSLCTLEFENNREIYDWLIDNVDVPARPRQIEFARLNLDYTVMSKRKLLRLVEEGRVSGWDDPRMPTIAGLRRRGVTPESIRAFCDLIGVAKADSRVDIGKLEYAVRDDLNFKAPRVMCVLRPLKVVITNWPEGEVDALEAPYWPHDVPREGSREVPFSGELYIERDDFMEEPPEKYFRLAPGREVRLRYGYFIRCEEVVKDDAGEVVELRCTYDPDTRGGSAPDGRKVKGTLHWVSAAHAAPVEVRLYDRLFSVPDPDEGDDFTAHLNPESLIVVEGALGEPGLADAPADAHYQFERQGYFYTDPAVSGPGAPVFNRVVTLRDTWARVARAEQTTRRTKEKKPKEPAMREKTIEETIPKEGAKTPERDPVAALSKEELARFERYTEELGLDRDDAMILASEPNVADFYEEALQAHDNPQGVANWVVNELRRELKDRSLDELPFGGEHLGSLVGLIDDETITGTIAKDIFVRMVETGEDPLDIIEQEGLEQLTRPDEIAPVVEEVVGEHPEQVERYREGKSGVLGFFVGQVMDRTDGAANPQLVQRLLRERLADDEHTRPVEAEPPSGPPARQGSGTPRTGIAEEVEPGASEE